MIKYFCFFVFCLFRTSLICAQFCIAEDHQTNNINFAEIDYYLQVSQEVPYIDTLENDSTIAYITLLNCKGKSTFVMIHKESNIPILKGEYSESLGVLREYALAINEVADEVYALWEFYQPLQNGNWIYKNKDGEIIKVENYNKGILEEAYRIKRLKNDSTSKNVLIKGTLKSSYAYPHGSPIQSAIVKLKGLDMEQTTNENGHFFFEAEEDGEYQVEVARNGFPTFTTKLIKFEAGDTLKIDFYLKSNSW